MESLKEACKKDKLLARLAEVYPKKRFVYSERWGMWVLNDSNPYL